MTDLEILNKLSSKRSKPTTYARCMGYLRPVESFNTGKKGEFEERKWFTESAANKDKRMQ